MNFNGSKRDDVAGVRGYSMAMYSTWLWHRASRSMFDAGEGIGNTMRNNVFAIERIFLSHGHHDHFGGIPGLAFARGAARGDKGKPFSVYHPAGWSKIDALKTYVASAGDLGYDISWVKVRPGDEVPIFGNAFVRAFEVEHVSRLCLGYAMVEKRSRLRNELVGRPESEIAKIASRDGKTAVCETYEKIVMAYSGDTSGVPVNSVRDADVLFHEATFVEDGAIVNSGNEKTVVRVDGGHSTVRGAVRIATEANVGELVLMHVSTRFSVESAVIEAAKAVADFGFNGMVSLLHGNRFFTVAEHR